MEDVQWIKLQVGDDWGAKYLAINRLNERGFADKRACGLRLERGEPVRVRWPSGSVTDEVIHLNPYRATVRDHGNTRDVDGEAPGVIVHTNGVPCFVPLEGLEVDLEWAKSREPARGLNT